MEASERKEKTGKERRVRRKEGWDKLIATLNYDVTNITTIALRRY